MKKFKEYLKGLWDIMGEAMLELFIYLFSLALDAPSSPFSDNSMRLKTRIGIRWASSASSHWLWWSRSSARSLASSRKSNRSALRLGCAFCPFFFH